MSTVSQDIHLIAAALGNSMVRGTLQVGFFDAGGQATWEYNFATNGGAVGTITLPGTVPANSVVHGGIIRVATAPTSGGSATVALRLEGAGDILGATAIASLTAGNYVTVPVPQTANTWVTTTQARALQVVVATAALTAGRIFVNLRYSTFPA